MSLRPQHEIHQRRMGRNVGVGLLLAALVALIVGLTVVKIGSGAYQMQPGVTNGN